MIRGARDRQPAGTQFNVIIDTPLPPEVALRRVLDLRAHDRVIPLTRVMPAVSVDELYPGFEFVARTGLGRLDFDDPMRVEQIEVTGPTGAAEAVIVKHGRVIQGAIHLQVTGEPTGSRVHWHQDVRLGWLPAFAQAPAGWLLRRGYRWVLVRLLAD